MTEARSTDELPVLAVIFSARSRPWTEIVDAGADLCRFLWIVDSSRPDSTGALRLLPRFGTVVDGAGLGPEELIQRVADEEPDGITSFFDADLHRHAWLAEALDLPSPSVRSVARLTDKVLQRQAFAAAGVPGPRFSAVREPVDGAELARLSGALTFPLVCKPRSGTACRDVVPVADADELAQVLSATTHPAEMILEELMADVPAGTTPAAARVSIDTLVSRGVFSHLGITGLFPMMPPFRSSGGYFPADVVPEEVPGLFAMAGDAIAALGSDFGCYRTEIKLTPEGHKVIEVNGRPSGITPVNVQLAAGIPLLQLCMRLSLGEHVVIEGPVACQRVAYRYYCEPPLTATRYLGSTGLDELGTLPGIVQIDVHKQPGDAVDWHNGSLDKIFQVTGAVADHAELAEHYRACTELVVSRYEHRS